MVVLFHKIKLISENESESENFIKMRRNILPVVYAKSKSKKNIDIDVDETNEETIIDESKEQARSHIQKCIQKMDNMMFDLTEDEIDELQDVVGLIETDDELEFYFTTDDPMPKPLTSKIEPEWFERYNTDSTNARLDTNVVQSTIMEPIIEESTICERNVLSPTSSDSQPKMAIEYVCTGSKLNIAGTSNVNPLVPKRKVPELIHISTEQNKTRTKNEVMVLNTLAEEFASHVNQKYTYTRNSVSKM